MDRNVLNALLRMDPRELQRILGRARKTADRKRSRLVAKRDALARRVDAIDRELSLLGDGQAPQRKRSATRPSRGPRKGRVTARDAAYAVLSKRTKPMKVRDLAKAVLASGKVKSSSPAFAQNLGLAMRADKRFRKVDYGVYAVRSTAKVEKTAPRRRSKRTRSPEKATTQKPGVAVRQVS